MLLAIDLGTTNSVAAVWHEGGAKLITGRYGSPLLPSVVSMLDPFTTLIGNPAKERLRAADSETFACFKRAMGTRKAFGQANHDAVLLSSLVLKVLKEDAEAAMKTTFAEAIITVPAYFNEPQRLATKQAAELAGLSVRRLINEPTAAALAYSLHDQAEEAPIIVLDLGGGTFDISIIEKFEQILDVHASGGDCFLGGEDFTAVLVEMLAAQIGSNHRQHPQLRFWAEECKKALTNAESWQHQYVSGDTDVTLVVDRAAFERQCQPLLARMLKPIERALRDANMRPDSFDQVVLAGGATRMPMIKKMVATYFKRLPLMALDPDTVIALGAATAAGMEEAAVELGDRVMTDVCPFTLGVEIMDNGVTGLFSPLIERNQKVPISREGLYSPIHLGQEYLTLQIYQGESRYVRDNTLIGSLRVPLLPGAKEFDVVTVRFTYDLSGLLEVEAKTRLSGAHARTVIHRDLNQANREQDEARLAALQKLKIHPRDAAENQGIIDRGTRLYAETLGATRENIALALADFTRTLNTQDLQKITEITAYINRFFDAIEQGKTL